MIRYKNLNQSDTKLNIISDTAIEPATEQEEYDGLMNPALIDPSKIDAWKNSYIRYMTYIDREIPLDCIAPIRQYWINHILELVPADL